MTALLEDDNKFGFIVMDGNGALFGTLCGNTRDVLHKFTVDLPKKHGNQAWFHNCVDQLCSLIQKRHHYILLVIHSLVSEDTIISGIRYERLQCFYLCIC